MQRILIFMYGLVSYGLFFVTFLYAIGFVGNLFVPKGIDSPPELPLMEAFVVNLGLLALFAVQHSLMARPFFKRWLTRFIPEAAERSTYVMASSLALIVLFVFWQPMGGVIWSVETAWAQMVLHGLFVLGWLIVFYSSFLINHFDLFGLRQVWLNLRNKPYTQLDFGTPFLYSLVRHPLYLGFLLGFWATPLMTVAHLVFAVGTTAYILIAIQLEEYDLITAHPEYRAYRDKVPMIVPLLKLRPKPDTTHKAARA